MRLILCSLQRASMSLMYSASVQDSFRTQRWACRLSRAFAHSRRPRARPSWICEKQHNQHTCTDIRRCSCVHPPWRSSRPAGEHPQQTSCRPLGRPRPRRRERGWFPLRPFCVLNRRPQGSEVGVIDGELEACTWIVNDYKRLTGCNNQGGRKFRADDREFRSSSFCSPRFIHSCRNVVNSHKMDTAQIAYFMIYVPVVYVFGLLFDPLRCNTSQIATSETTENPALHRLLLHAARRGE